MDKNKWPMSHMTKSMKTMLLYSVIVFGGIFTYLIGKSYVGSYFMANHKQPPATVSAMNVKQEPWQKKIQATASLVALNGVSVTSEISGIVKAIHFESGANVKKGDLLVEMNVDAEKAQLQALEAQASLAQITYDRNVKLLTSKATSQATVDSDLAELKSRKAQVAQQEALIAKKTIKAPFDGRVGIGEIDIGQYLSPGQKIVTLQSVPLQARFSLPQQLIPQLKVGQDIVLTTDAFKEKSFKGKISAISPLVDSVTRNGQIEATIKNEQGDLMPGMYGFIEVYIGSASNAFTLPQAAITYNPYGDLVYVLKEDSKDDKGSPIFKAEQKFVTLGEERGDQVQILTGLEEGEYVVTTGQMKLKNGSMVVVNNSVAPGNNPTPALKSH